MHHIPREIQKLLLTLGWLANNHNKIEKWLQRMPEFNGKDLGKNKIPNRSRNIIKDLDKLVADAESVEDKLIGDKRFGQGALQAIADGHIVMDNMLNTIFKVKNHQKELDAVIKVFVKHTNGEELPPQLSNQIQIILKMVQPYTK